MSREHKTEGKVPSEQQNISYQSLAFIFQSRVDVFDALGEHLISLLLSVTTVFSRSAASRRLNAKSASYLHAGRRSSARGFAAVLENITLLVLRFSFQGHATKDPMLMRLSGSAYQQALQSNARMH